MKTIARLAFDLWVINKHRPARFLLLGFNSRVHARMTVLASACVIARCAPEAHPWGKSLARWHFFKENVEERAHKAHGARTLLYLATRDDVNDSPHIYTCTHTCTYTSWDACRFNAPSRARTLINNSTSKVRNARPLKTMDRSAVTILNACQFVRTALFFVPWTGCLAREFSFTEIQSEHTHLYIIV